MFYRKKKGLGGHDNWWHVAKLLLAYSHPSVAGCFF